MTWASHELTAIWLTLKLPVQIRHSPYCQPYNSYDVSSESLVLDQLIIIPKLIFLFILIINLVDIVRRNSVLDTTGS